LPVLEFKHRLLPGMLARHEFLLRGPRAVGGRRGRRKEVVHLPLDEPWMDLRQVDVREGKPRHVVAILKEGVELFEARDLGGQYEWFRLPVEREVAAGARAIVVRLTKLFNLNFADGLAHPAGGSRLAGFEEDLGGRL